VEHVVLPDGEQYKSTEVLMQVGRPPSPAGWCVELQQS